jgi:hypothetical protein
MDPVETTIEQPRRLITRRRFFVAVVLVAVLAIPVAFVFAPHTETNYKCPLTGRDRVVIERLGLTVSDHIASNDVSVWAEANSIAGVVADQCGWETASTVTHE